MSGVFLDLDLLEKNEETNDTRTASTHILP